MALCDFLISKLKRIIKGQFSTIDEIKEKSQAKLTMLLKEVFYQCFPYQKVCWCKYIISQQNYFEGDRINVEE